MIHVSVFMPIPSCLYYYSFVAELDIRDGDASRGSHIVQECFDCPSCFDFFLWNWVCFFQGLWRFVMGLWWWCIESIDCFLWDGNFSSVDSTYSKTWDIFFIFWYSLNFFLSETKSLIIQVCLGLSPRYFMLFVARVKVDVSWFLFQPIYHLYKERQLFFFS